MLPTPSRNGVVVVPTAGSRRAARFTVFARFACAAALALAMFGVAPARATIDAQSQPVVQRYLEATGGRAAFESERTHHATGVIEAFGLKGRLDQWSAIPDKSATQVKLGPFDLRNGYDGTVAWRTDPSGKVLMLDGKDLEDAKSSTWFETERWLAADQGGGTVKFAGNEKDSAGAYAVLEIAAPIGRPRRFYFDTKSGLIVRSVAKSDAQTVTSTVSDYRRVVQRLVAFKTVQQVAGMTMNNLTLTLDSIEVNVDIPASQFAPPATEGAGGLTWLKTPGVAKLPFMYLGRHVWLRASVNGGPPADFIYDTGASITVLDSAYAAKIGVKTEGQLQGQGAASAGTGSFGTLQSLRVASADGDGIEVKDSKIAVLSVNSTLAPFFWRDCAGIIGFDVISRFVNEIDYDAKTLTWYDPKTWAYAGKGTAIPFTLAGHVPVAKFTLDDKYSGDFRLDVGSSSTVDLHAPFVEKNGLDAVVKPTHVITGGGFGGTFESRIGRMQKMAIGPYSWTKPTVILSNAKGGAFASEDYAGNVGNHILERFKLTLDYEHRVAWLEPGARYGSTDGFSRVGCQLAWIDGHIEVGQVMAGSPAAKAGLTRGDVVIAVDGKAPLDVGLDPMDDAMEKGAVGSKMKFEIQRGGKKMTKTVKLADVV